MIRIFANNWGLVLLRGILAILFGIATLLLPGITLIVLVVLFGAYALTDGVATIILAIQQRQEFSDWWLMLLAGLVSVAAGVVTFVWPGITAITLFYVIVAWAIMSGIFEIILAIHLRREIEGEWAMILSGILSVAFGILLILQPVSGVLAVLWMIGIYAILYGALLVVLSHQLHNLQNLQNRINQDSPRSAHAS
jgi:uncharacterized membrane protein HdeD (DUF308 family)